MSIIEGLKSKLIFVPLQLHTELVKKELEVANLEHTLEITREDLERRRKVRVWLQQCM